MADDRIANTANDYHELRDKLIEDLTRANDKTRWLRAIKEQYARLGGCTKEDILSIEREAERLENAINECLTLLENMTLALKISNK